MTLDMSFVHWRDKGDSWRILWDRMGKWLGLFWRWASPTFTTSRTEQKSHVGAGIIGDRLVGQVMVPEVFIVISAVYCNLLIEILDLWLYHMHISHLRTLVFMHENALSHYARDSETFLDSCGIKGEKLMVCPPASLYSNPIENIWPIFKKGCLCR